MAETKKIIHIVGARPNFIKIANILRTCNATEGLESILVHTGQHYSSNMSDSFFTDLGIPRPDINLEVGSGSHAQQTAEIMKRFEPVVLEHKPDAVLVVGDVNSTVACAMVAVKLGITTVHVEAGLRSFDRGMPEEINRVITDLISDLLFVTEQSGIDNLAKEGISDGKVHFVGNVMIDTLEQHREKSAASKVLQQLGLDGEEYAVVTLHRPSNVDGEMAFKRIMDALAEIQKDMKVVFPMHPRTRNNLESLGLLDGLTGLDNMIIAEPLGYLDFMKLMSEANIVITDSGGIQEETTILGVPCLTVRENTERPVTITEGTNILVGTQTERIMAGYRQSMSNRKEHNRPKFWDGKASERIVEILSRTLS